MGVVLGLGLAALGGCMIPIEFFSDTMQRVAHLTPHAWAIDAFAVLVRQDGTIVDILPELGVLAVVRGRAAHRRRVPPPTVDAYRLIGPLRIQGSSPSGWENPPMQKISRRPADLAGGAAAVVSLWLLITNWGPIAAGHPSYLVFYIGLIVAGAATVVWAVMHPERPYRRWLSILGAVGSSCSRSSRSG
jgi:hypothetical protein